MCGTLLTLQEDLQERSIQLTCYDINGQIRSINTRPQLATCLANVITDIQTGLSIITAINNFFNIFEFEKGAR